MTDLQAITKNGTSGEAASDSEALLQRGNYGVTGKLLYQIIKANLGESVVSSAFSVLTPLAQILLYSKGETYTEILQVLNLQSADQIRHAFLRFLDAVKTSEGTELSLAAKVYVKDTYQLSESFKRDARDIFNADGESINFSKPGDAAGTINQWVSGVTKGKIKDLVTAEMFDSLTRIVLANAIFFKGTWKTEFDAKHTKKADFYVDGQNTKHVDMMELKIKMNYNAHADLDAQTIELPYKDENVTFVVILPNKKDGLLSLVEKLQDGDTLDKAVSSFSYETVNLFMPKFDISTKTDLKETLQAIGVKRLFTKNAELNGMIVPDEPLYVSAAVQKATITVDEKGAVAAAANAFVCCRITSVSAPEPRIITFKADHPYVYCIKARKVVIFCGVDYG